MWLEAVVAEPGGDGTGGKVTRNEKGTPQSGVMVILAREWTGELTDWVEARLEGKFGLEINREKTRVVARGPGGESLDFLG